MRGSVDTCDWYRSCIVWNSSLPVVFAILEIEPDIIAWDLRHGIPFDEGSFDVVHHFHLLEHIDREAVAAFLGECPRVLKPGGSLRVVVPDLEIWSKRYLLSLQSGERGHRKPREACGCAA